MRDALSTCDTPETVFEPFWLGFIDARNGPDQQ